MEPLSAASNNNTPLSIPYAVYHPHQGHLAGGQWREPLGSDRGFTVTSRESGPLQQQRPRRQEQERLRVSVGPRAAEQQRPVPVERSCYESQSERPGRPGVFPTFTSPSQSSSILPYQAILYASSVTGVSTPDISSLPSLNTSNVTSTPITPNGGRATSSLSTTTVMNNSTAMIPPRSQKPEEQATYTKADCTGHPGGSIHLSPGSSTSPSRDCELDTDTAGPPTIDCSPVVLTTAFLRGPYATQRAPLVPHDVSFSQATHISLRQADSTTNPNKSYSWVSRSCGTYTKKRHRRRYDEIERNYKCLFPGCPKAYGTLNHLNAHIVMQRHGPKRLPSEFKELRQHWRRRKGEEARKKQYQVSAAARAMSTVSHLFPSLYPQEGPVIPVSPGRPFARGSAEDAAPTRLSYVDPQSTPPATVSDCAPVLQLPPLAAPGVSSLPVADAYAVVHAEVSSVTECAPTSLGTPTMVDQSLIPSVRQPCVGRNASLPNIPQTCSPPALSNDLPCAVGTRDADSIPIHTCILGQLPVSSPVCHTLTPASPKTSAPRAERASPPGAADSLRTESCHALPIVLDGGAMECPVPTYSLVSFPIPGPLSAPLPSTSVPSRFLAALPTAAGGPYCYPPP